MHNRWHDGHQNGAAFQSVGGLRRPRDFALTLQRGRRRSGTGAQRQGQHLTNKLLCAKEGKVQELRESYLLNGGAARRGLHVHSGILLLSISSLQPRQAFQETRHTMELRQSSVLGSRGPRGEASGHNSVTVVPSEFQTALGIHGGRGEGDLELMSMG